MSATRLFVLGALARGGPMHGHQIRRAAQIDRTELWSDVKPGSLYGALQRMAAEGLVEPLRTEQEGNLPARTIYAITTAGHAELRILRDALLRDTKVRPDPVDLALQNTHDLSEEALTAVVEQRRAAIEVDLRAWRVQRETAAPYLTPLEAQTFEHTLVRLEAELAWHERLVAELPKIFAADTTEDGRR